MQEIDQKDFNNRCPNCGSSNLASTGGHQFNTPMGECGIKTNHKCRDCGFEFTIL